MDEEKIQKALKRPIRMRTDRPFDEKIDIKTTNEKRNIDKIDFNRQDWIENKLAKLYAKYRKKSPYYKYIPNQQELILEWKNFNSYEQARDYYTANPKELDKLLYGKNIKPSEMVIEEEEKEKKPKKEKRFTTHEESAKNVISSIMKNVGNRIDVIEQINAERKKKIEDEKPAEEEKPMEEEKPAEVKPEQSRIDYKFTGIQEKGERPYIDGERLVYTGSMIKAKYKNEREYFPLLIGPRGGFSTINKNNEYIPKSKMNKEFIRIVDALKNEPKHKKIINDIYKKLKDVKIPSEAERMQAQGITPVFDENGIVVEGITKSSSTPIKEKRPYIRRESDEKKKEKTESDEKKKPIKEPWHAPSTRSTNRSKKDVKDVDVDDE
jgi:hypothetical protein